MRNVITITKGACHEYRMVAAISLVLIFLSACGDNDSSSVAPNNEPSSSSVIPSSAPESSSAEGQGSLSSSSVTSAGSVTLSSSSVMSGNEEPSSNSADAVESSSLAGFDWNLPKEVYLNSGITYDTIIDSRDGKVYRTVKIGNQVWMAENLNYADSSNTPSLNGRSWCFRDQPRNCELAGRLYTWAAAIDSVRLATDTENPQTCGDASSKNCKISGTIQGLCPDGWHLPSEMEWDTLFTTVGGYEVAGKILKSQRGWESNHNGTDDFGFSALPVGCYDFNEIYFYWDGSYAEFWSSTQSSDAGAYSIYLKNPDKVLVEYNDFDGFGHSVRCLKD